MILEVVARAAGPAVTTASRGLIVGLLLVPLLIVTASSIPALMILPFTREGTSRIETYMTLFITWTRTILTYSR
jgi:hypothetical protein